MFWQNVLRRKFDLEDKMSFKTFSQNFYNISNEMKVLFEKNALEALCAICSEI